MLMILWSIFITDSLKMQVYHSYDFVKINRNLLANGLVDLDVSRCSQKLPVYDKHFHYVIWNTCILYCWHIESLEAFQQLQASKYVKQ